MSCPWEFDAIEQGHHQGRFEVLMENIKHLTTSEQKAWRKVADLTIRLKFQASEWFFRDGRTQGENFSNCLAGRLLLDWIFHNKAFRVEILWRFPKEDRPNRFRGFTANFISNYFGRKDIRAAQSWQFNEIWRVLRLVYISRKLERRFSFGNSSVVDGYFIPSFSSQRKTFSATFLNSGAITVRLLRNIEAYIHPWSLCDSSSNVDIVVCRLHIDIPRGTTESWHQLRLDTPSLTRFLVTTSSFNLWCNLKHRVDVLRLSNTLRSDRVPWHWITKVSNLWRRISLGVSNLIKHANAIPLAETAAIALSRLNFTESRKISFAPYSHGNSHIGNRSKATLQSRQGTYFRCSRFLDWFHIHLRVYGKLHREYKKRSPRMTDSTE